MDGQAVSAIINNAQEAIEPQRRVVRLDGINYADRELTRIIPREATPKELVVASLSGFCGYIEAEFDAEAKKGCIVHIESPHRVTLKGPLYGPAKQRDVVAAAVYGGDDHPWTRYQDHESALIYLRTRFEQTDFMKALLTILGNVSDAEVRTFADDGITQEANTRVGVSLKTTAQVPNPAFLRPFRTFIEVVQPESPFLLRLQRGSNAALPTMALFECDGGAWKVEATGNIKVFLAGHVAGLPIIG